jgi:hypothetical protein
MSNGMVRHYNQKLWPNYTIIIKEEKKIRRDQCALGAKGKKCKKKKIWSEDSSFASQRTRNDDIA